MHCLIFFFYFFFFSNGKFGGGGGVQKGIQKGGSRKGGPRFVYTVKQKIIIYWHDYIHITEDGIK